MRKIVVLVSSISIFSMAPAALADVPSESPIAKTVRQLILVRAPSWASSSGHLERYEREDAGSWRVVGSVVHVNLGRHGLAWGRGLQPRDEVGPAKREGDGRSPAGIFPLDKAFGAGDSLPTGAAGFPYLHATASMYCVEDVHSNHYNEIIDASEVKPGGWQRWSPLRRLDGLFRWGVVVRQNDPDVVVGAGSCVFLHIWRGERRPTAGCTSMSAESLEQILRWLDAKSQPVLVQLPEPVYAAVGARWSLPEDDGESPAEK